MAESPSAAPRRLPLTIAPPRGVRITYRDTTTWRPAATSQSTAPLRRAAVLPGSVQACRAMRHATVGDELYAHWIDLGGEGG